MMVGEIELDEVDDHYIVKQVSGLSEFMLQTDYERCSVANTFGWDLGPWATCDHRSTDGTVKCDDCGKSVEQFISEATEFLDENIGATTEDPGYFEETVDFPVVADEFENGAWHAGE